MYETGITGGSPTLKYDVFFDRTVWGSKIRFVPNEWFTAPSMRIGYWKQKTKTCPTLTPTSTPPICGGVANQAVCKEIRHEYKDIECAASNTKSATLADTASPGD